METVSFALEAIPALSDPYHNLIPEAVPMTKINIISGFLGAGKTTLIKKLLDGAFQGEKVILLENEYGEVGIDGGFMKDTGIQITELNSGCICCTLVGDFTDAIGDLME